MRFSLNTITLALVSSSVLMTDVFAAPVTNSLKQALKHPKRSLQSRQQASGFNVTEVSDLLELVFTSANGIASLGITIEQTTLELATLLNIPVDADGNIGASFSGDDGSGSGDDSTDSGNSTASAGGDGGDDSGDAGSGSASDDGSPANGTASNVLKRQGRSGADAGDLDASLCDPLGLGNGCV